MTTSTTSVASSYTPVPQPFPYPPPPKSSLIKRAIAIYRYRKLKKQWNKLDAERLERELKNGPGQPYRSVSKASLSEYYNQKFMETSTVTTPSSGVSLASPELASSTAPTTPSSEHEPTLIDSTSDATKDNSQGAAKETPFVSTPPKDALRLYLNRDALTSSRTLNVIPDSPPPAVPTPLNEPSSVEVEPLEVVNTEPSLTEGAQLLRSLKTWVDEARKTHVGTPIYDERPMAGRDFEMNWATITEEDEDEEDHLPGGFQPHGGHCKAGSSGSSSYDSDDEDDEDLGALIDSFPSTPTSTSCSTTSLPCAVVIHLNGTLLDLDAYDFCDSSACSKFGANYVPPTQDAGYLSPDLLVFQRATSTIQVVEVNLDEGHFWPDFEWSNPLLL